MPDYEKMYYTLFNGVTNAIEQIEHMDFGQAAQTLRKAQIDAEESYIHAEEKLEG